MTALELYDVETYQPRFKTLNVSECRDYISDYSPTHRFEAAASADFLGFSHHEFTCGRVSLHIAQLNCRGGFSIAKSIGDEYAFQFVLGGSCALSGPRGEVVVRPGEVFVLDPDQCSREFWADGCQQVMVRVDRDVIEQAVSAELNRTISKHISFDPVAPDPGMARWLVHLVREVQHSLTAPSLLREDRVVRDLERSLLTMLLTGFRHSESEALDMQGRTIAPYYVRRAESFIQEHAREAITIDDVAEQAGVSARSLFYGFKRWRSTTPMAYVRDLRLDLARQELQSANETGGAVSQAAMNAGFQNFSQFSRLYKARFNEVPSATLLRRSRQR